MSEIYINNVAGDLASGITSGATSIPLAAGHNFIDPGAGNWYRATLHQDETNYEVVAVTALASGTLTVERDIEGLGAKSYNAGDPIEHRWTAGGADGIRTLIWLGV